MARIRSIHPGLWTDEAFVSVSPLARLLFIGIWNEADDQGVFPWKPVTLKMRLLPADGVDTAALLTELTELGMLMKFQVGSAVFGAVRNFRKFQRPERPNRVHPITDEVSAFVALSATTSTGSEKRFPGFTETPAPEDARSAKEHRPLAVETPTLHRKSGQMEEGGGREEKNMPDLRLGVHSPLPQQGDLIEPEPVVAVAAKVRAKRGDRDEPEGFAEFYAAYPRHDGRAKAAAAFPAAVKAAGSLEALMGFLRAFTFPEQAAKFAPYPATWLNDRRWRDNQGVPAPAVSAGGTAINYDPRYWDLEPADVALLPQPRTGSAEYNAWLAALEGKTWPRPGATSNARGAI
jgi:hypothetical protein